MMYMKEIRNLSFTDLIEKLDDFDYNFSGNESNEFLQDILFDEVGIYE